MDFLSIVIFLGFGLAGVGLAIWGIVLLRRGQAERRIWSALNSNGASALGEVVEVMTKGQTLQVIAIILDILTVLASSRAPTMSSSSTITYYATVRYPVPQGTENKAYSVIRRVKNRDTYKVGDKVEIRYLPQSPEVARLAAESQSTAQFQITGWVLIGIGVVCMLFGVLIGVGNSTSTSQRNATSTAYMLQLSATPDEAQKTATAVAATATAVADIANVKALESAFKADIAQWKQVDDLKAHRAEDAKSLAIFIDYGRCASGKFYAIFWKRLTDRLTIGDVLTFYYAGYGYYENASPDDCYPKDVYSQVWSRHENPHLGGGWYAIQGAIDIKLEKK